MYPTCGAQLDGGTEKVEIVPTCMNSHDFLSSFPSCKPVVVALDKQMLMFGLLHMSCIVTVCMLVGSLVVIAYLRYSSEMLRTFPYSNCMIFSQASCKPVVLDKRLFRCIRLLCVWYLYCTVRRKSPARTPKCTRVDGLHPKVHGRKIDLLYIGCLSY